VVPKRYRSDCSYDRSSFAGVMATLGFLSLWLRIIEKVLLKESISSLYGFHGTLILASVDK
jgi:hypothetical protein